MLICLAVLSEGLTLHQFVDRGEQDLCSSMLIIRTDRQTEGSPDYIVFDASASVLFLKFAQQVGLNFWGLSSSH